MIKEEAKMDVVKMQLQRLQKRKEGKQQDCGYCMSCLMAVQR